MIQFIQTQGVQLLGAPHYSLDLAACDFWLFSKLMKPRHGINFEMGKELMNLLQEELGKLRKADFLVCSENDFF
jgi:hypothetical protein